LWRQFAVSAKFILGPDLGLTDGADLFEHHLGELLVLKALLIDDEADF